MKIPYCLFIVLACGAACLSSPAEEPEKACAKALVEFAVMTPSPEAWFKKHIPLIKSIKAGSTRADLDKLFLFPGGLYNKKWTYRYRECPFIRVEVEFQNAYQAARTPDPGDKIVSISKPYLDDSFPID